MTALGDYVAAAAQPTLVEAADRPAGRPFDELVGADGTLRPAWAGLAPRLATLDAGDLARYADDAARRVVDGGVVYHRPGDGTASAPPEPEAWRLDPLPVVVGAAEWRTLEVGLVQRAELLEALLVDLCGEQRLLATGVLPPEVLWAHPEPLRPVLGGRTPARRLVVTATDLVRGTDGGWVVVGDRTQAPSGAGFALAGRRVVSRVAADLHRSAGPRRLAPWFSRLREALLAAAPPGVGDPRAVVLSPGPLSETAYDQATLAATLGLPLVEGRDLVVRDGSLWRRSLDEPEPVHVVLRRVDTEWCDPLDLRPSSRLGVTGLVEAVRRGTVVVANSLGSGVLENPALAAFLPAACEALLGEELRLGGPATWWCGEPSGLSHVLAHAEDLEVLPLGGPAPVDRTDLLDRVRAEPHAWVGRQRVEASHAPRVADGGLVGAPFGLRTFVVADGPSWSVLPGGVGRVDARTSSTAAKDVWVLPGTGEEQEATEPAGTAYPLAVPAAAVPRVLEDLFWVGRYAERAEGLLRLLRATWALAADVGGHGADGQRRPAPARLLAASAAVSGTPAGEPGDLRADLLVDLLVDADREGTVAHALAALAQAAQGVRDQLSDDVWLVLADAERALVEARRRRSEVPAREAGRVLAALLALGGVVAETMVRDAGWQLLEAGRRVERAQQVVALLRACLVVRTSGADERAVVAAVLAATESTLTHRRRYRGSGGDAGLAGVVELLVRDPENPRSVAFSVVRAAAALASVPGTGVAGRPRRIAQEVLDEVARADPATLVAGDGDRTDLDRLLGVLEARLADLADAVAEHHFDAGDVPRPLDAPGTEPA